MWVIRSLVSDQRKANVNEFVADRIYCTHLWLAQVDLLLIEVLEFLIVLNRAHCGHMQHGFEAFVSIAADSGPCSDRTSTTSLERDYSSVAGQFSWVDDLGKPCCLGHHSPSQYVTYAGNAFKPF